MAPILGAVADDVTGASDLCSTLVRQGMRTVQTFGVPAADLELGGFDAVVAGLKTRTAPVADAVAESLAALERLRALGTSHVFLKVCSTFDSTPEGNIGPVADALLDALGGDLALVCPAFPANGRTVYLGHLFVHEALLSESSLARHPLTPMTDANLVRWLGRQTPRRVGLVPYPAVAAGPEAIARRLEELRASGTTYAVADALEDTHLRALGPAAAGLPLVVGGSGLALGLPDAYRAQGLLGHEGSAAVEPVRNGAAVVLSGSCSQATNEQVRRMAASRPAIRVGPDDSAEAVAA
jgi:3-dehydrotetronate 4-kinase